MENIKEKSLRSALERAGLVFNGLPVAYKGADNRFWIKAVVLVRKTNLEECYCLYSHETDGRMTLECDCGSGTGVILGDNILSIHPYLYLDEQRFMPYQTPDDRKEALMRIYSKDDTMKERIAGASNDEIYHILLDYAVNRQLECFDEDRVNDSFSDIASRTLEFDREKSDIAFKAKLAEMYRRGERSSVIDAAKEEYERKMSAKKDKANIFDNSNISEDDTLRGKMESKYTENKGNVTADKTQQSEATPVEGEFDDKGLTDEEYEDVKLRTKMHDRDVKRSMERRLRQEEIIIKNEDILQDENGDYEECETLAMSSDLGDFADDGEFMTNDSLRKIKPKRIAVVTQRGKMAKYGVTSVDELPTKATLGRVNSSSDQTTKKTAAKKKRTTATRKKAVSESADKKRRGRPKKSE